MKTKVEEAAEKPSISRTVAMNLRKKYGRKDPIWTRFYIESDTPYGNNPYRSPRFVVKERPTWMAELANMSNVEIEDAMEWLNLKGESGVLDDYVFDVYIEGRESTYKVNWQDAMCALFDKDACGYYYVQGMDGFCRHEWQGTMEGDAYKTNLCQIYVADRRQDD